MENEGIIMSLMDPVSCHIDVSSGSLTGTDRRYQKRFDDLDGLYADQNSYQQLKPKLGEQVVYEVTDYHPGERCQNMIFGVTKMQPGRVGNEFFMTRGHIHANADRPEVYIGKKGHGLMLMESPEGETKVIEIGPDDVCYVPPYWIHRSVNTGDSEFVMFFCYPSDSGQDYSIIEKSGGMKHRVLSDGNGGWVLSENPEYQPRSDESIQQLYRGSIG
ncbi:putative glucose-6-phosphate isomerase [Vibrio nigripulchritudo SOn1]|uniref:Glucose-6-phosphate isomerase n=2 Tax=Vibrio nigripulchritudo TaxID=28173 RepID=A0AAV2VRN3_9VIBR|nr:putative glucose-6-phosphate isomerase [Vibrio nigripulchritudo SOn1]